MPVKVEIDFFYDDLKLTYNGDSFELSDDFPEEGDIIQIVDKEKELPSFITRGAFYEVESIDCDDDVIILDNDGDEYTATRLSVLVFKREKLPYSVGDFVRVTSMKNTSKAFSSVPFDIDDVCEVTYVAQRYVTAENVVTKDQVRIAKGDFTAATEAEANGAKIKAVLRNLGRSEGEIKQGDVVQVITYSHGHDVGTIGIASEDGYTSRVYVLANSDIYVEQVRLIAPVESTVGKPQ